MEINIHVRTFNHQALDKGEIIWFVVGEHMSN